MSPDPEDDPFRHIPRLKGRIADPAGSRFRAFDYGPLDRALGDGGANGWRRTDAEREATRHEALAGRMDDDLWVFAYGSLMWDPAFYFAEVRHALTPHYHRTFCLRSELGRGSPERPGLMAALDALPAGGGECHGLAFRIARAAVEAETRIIWRREMFAHAYAPRFIALETPQGPVEALAFVMDQTAERYVPELGLEESARLIATGEGILGKSLHYLDNLAEHFELLEIEDEAFFRLYRRAREIAGLG